MQFRSGNAIEPLSHVQLERILITRQAPVKAVQQVCKDMAQIDTGKGQARADSTSSTERHQMGVRSILAKEPLGVELLRVIEDCGVAVDGVDVEDQARVGREMIPRHARRLA